MGINQFMVDWLWLSLAPHSENHWSSVFSILQSARQVTRSHMNAYMSTNAVNVYPGLLKIVTGALNCTTG